MVLQCFCMMEEMQGSWGLNEIKIITISGFSFFSTFFKATSLGVALARTIAESTIVHPRVLVCCKFVQFCMQVVTLILFYTYFDLGKLLDCPL